MKPILPKESHGVVRVTREREEKSIYFAPAATTISCAVRIVGFRQPPDRAVHDRLKSD